MKKVIVAKGEATSRRPPNIDENKRTPNQGKLTSKAIADTKAWPISEAHSYDFRKQRGRRAPLKMRSKG